VLTLSFQVASPNVSTPNIPYYMHDGNHQLHELNLQQWMAQTATVEEEENG